MKFLKYMQSVVPSGKKRNVENNTGRYGTDMIGPYNSIHFETGAICSSSICH